MALPPPDGKIERMRWDRGPNNPYRSPHAKPPPPKPPRKRMAGLYVERPHYAKDFRCAIDAAINVEIIECAHRLGVSRERLVHDILTTWVILKRQLESDLGAVENPERILPNLVEPYEGYGDKIALRYEGGIETL